MAAAFAFALQMLLGGILVTQAEAAPVSSGSSFEICLSDGGAGQPDHDTGKAQHKHLQCVLCTLAKFSHAIVPADAAAAFRLREFVAVAFPTAEHIAKYHSPTGHYQRGPPGLIG